MIRESCNQALSEQLLMQAVLLAAMTCTGCRPASRLQVAGLAAQSWVLHTTTC